MTEKFKLTKLEKSWILYDIGNSAFILLVSTLLPIYFNALAEGAGISESNYLAYWGYAGSVSTVLVAFIGPICGTMADQKGFKKKFFLICLALGAIGCAALGLAWSWLSFLVIFVIAKVGYSSCNVFYDSMLTEVTTESRMDKVSTMGYAFGYIGSVIPFLVCLVLVGMFQGGIQALSRSYLGKIIPAERSGEYYGLMDICGKGASFVGTTMIAVVSQLTEGLQVNLFGIPIANTGLAVGSIVILFIIGFILFCKADRLNKAQVAQ